MLKKLLIVGAGGALLLALLFGRDLPSMVRTGVTHSRSAVYDHIPMGFQLDRARQMIKDLDRPIRDSMHLIAKESVEVDKLQREVTKNEKDLAKSKTDILRLKEDLEKGGSSFVYAGTTYNEKQVREELKNRFSRFQTAEETNAKLVQLLAARERGLAAAREKLTAMEHSRRQLEVDVANLEARQKMVEVAQASSEINIDDSQLARTKDLIGEIRTRLDVAEKLVNTDSKSYGEIKLDSDSEDEDITAKVTKYFSGEEKESIESLANTK